jgi:hypothetical protein
VNFVKLDETCYVSGCAYRPFNITRQRYVTEITDKVQSSVKVAGHNDIT